MCSLNSNLLIFNPELKLWAVIAPRYSLFSAVGLGAPMAQIMQDLIILQKKPSIYTEINPQSKASS
jgi:hypothetical protein